MTTQPVRNLAETSAFVMACASARLAQPGTLTPFAPQIALAVPQNVAAGHCPACGGDDYSVRRGKFAGAECQWDECFDCGHKGEPC